MIKTSHNTLYALSGLLWLGIGVMLLNLGLGFLMHGFQGSVFVEDGYSSLIKKISTFTGGFDYAAIFLVILSLLVGFTKGRFVMQKAALKSAARISKLPNPTSFLNIYNRSNLILIAIMVGLGMTMKYLALPYDIRGSIDIAVGSALMQGSLAYFRRMTRLPVAAKD